MSKLFSKNTFYSSKVLLVIIGAIPGALLRWQINNDFLVNFLGATLIGFLYGLPFNSKRNLVFSLGFCGAFTTFSGLMVKTIQLFNNGLVLDSFYLIVLSFLLGILSLFAGFWMGEQLRDQWRLDRHKM